MMRMFSHYLAAGMVVCGAISSTAWAQEVKADPVSLKTVVGQKFAITFKIFEIDMQAAIGRGFQFPKSIGFEGSTYLYEVDAEFLRVFDQMHEAGMAKVFEADQLAVRSSEDGKTQAKGESTEYLFHIRSKVKDDDTVITNILLKYSGGFASDSIKIRSRLGQSIAFRLDDQSNYVRHGKPCWIIAKIDYAADEKSE